MNRVRTFVAPLLCAATMATGCTTGGGRRVNTAPVSGQHMQDRGVLIEYVQKLAPGASIRVQRLNGRLVRGTLMKATDAALVIQQRTRIPEPPFEIPMADIVSVTPETASGFSFARAIGAGAAAGAGAALAVFFVLVAIYD